MTIRQIARLACLIGAAWALTPAFGQSFTPLGNLGGGFSEADGVSDDGLVVSGSSDNAQFDFRAFRWTLATGMVDLGSFGGDFTEGSETSADGSFVVGGSDNLINRSRAFRWTMAGGLQDLGALTNNGVSFALAVSGKGQVVVGWSLDATGQEHAFRWTMAGGMINLGTFGGARSFAEDVSRDGSIIVGRARNQAESFRAFRWTLGGGMVDLGTLGGASASAEGISADGTIIVGSSTNPDSMRRAFRWTSGGGMVDIGVLPGGDGSRANAVSNTGVVVGDSESPSGLTAFIWTPGRGIRDLNAEFASVIPAGWHLELAECISPDGRFIVGHGTNPANREEGWLLDRGRRARRAGGFLPGVACFAELGHACGRYALARPAGVSGRLSSTFPIGNPPFLAGGRAT